MLFVFVEPLDQNNTFLKSKIYFGNYFQSLIVFAAAPPDDRTGFCTLTNKQTADRNACWLLASLGGTDSLAQQIESVIMPQDPHDGFS